MRDSHHPPTMSQCYPTCLILVGRKISISYGEKSYYPVCWSWTVCWTQRNWARSPIGSHKDASSSWRIFLVNLFFFFFLNLKSTLYLLPVWMYGCYWCWEIVKWCSPLSDTMIAPFICICSHRGRICFISSQSAWHFYAQSQPICDASCHIALSASETSSSSPALLGC